MVHEPAGQGLNRSIPELLLQNVAAFAGHRPKDEMPIAVLHYHRHFLIVVAERRSCSCSREHRVRQVQSLSGHAVIPVRTVDKVKGDRLLRRTGKGELEKLQRKGIADPFRYLVLEHGGQHIAILAQDLCQLQN